MWTAPPPRPPAASSPSHHPSQGRMWRDCCDSSVGTNNYKREFLRLDTGEFGPWDTTAFAACSYTSYDKFKGPGYLQKQQFNAYLPGPGRSGLDPAGDALELQPQQFLQQPHFLSDRLHPADGRRRADRRDTVPAGARAVPPLRTSPIRPTAASPAPAPVNNALGFGYNFDEAPTCTRVSPARPACRMTRSAPASMACASIRPTPAISACPRCSISTTTCR